MCGHSREKEGTEFPPFFGQNSAEVRKICTIKVKHFDFFWKVPRLKKEKAPHLIFVDKFWKILRKFGKILFGKIWKNSAHSPFVFHEGCFAKILQKRDRISGWQTVWSQINTELKIVTPSRHKLIIFEIFSSSGWFIQHLLITVSESLIMFTVVKVTIFSQSWHSCLYANDKGTSVMLVAKS